MNFHGHTIKGSKKFTISQDLLVRGFQQYAFCWRKALQLSIIPILHWIKYAYIYSLEKRIYKTFPPTPKGRKWNSTQAWKSRLERKWKRPNQFTLPFDKCSYWESKKGKKHLYPWEAKGSELTQSTGAASERCLVQPSLRHIAIPQ